MDSIDQHWINLKDGAEKAAAERGVELVFMTPNTKDDALQIEQVNNAVAALNGENLGGAVTDTGVSVLTK